MNMYDGCSAKTCGCHVLSDNVEPMTSRLLHSRFAVFLACLFGLLLLVGTPVRPVQSAPAGSGKASAAVVIAHDLADHGDVDDAGTCSLEDNTGNGMDDILHPFNLALLWAPMPSQAPASLSLDRDLHEPARLLRPPEAA